MKISIVTINYNDAEGLRKTLASVAEQTYRDIEHIIIDGGSSDESVNVIQDYVSKVERRESRVKSVVWSSEPDKGIYNAMNKGIEIALGRRVVNSFNRSERSEDKNKVVPDYVQILNSGDILAAPDVTERMAQAVEEVEYPGIIYGNMIRDFGNGKYHRDACRGERVKGLRNEGVKEVEWTMDDFIKGTVNHDPTYIRRDLYEKYGSYDEELKIVSDWKWFVKAIVFGGEKLYYVPIDVTIFDTTGISETNLASREAERRAELEKMLPAAILKDYDRYHFPIDQYKRLKKYHLWQTVYFIERVLFKLEKWHILK